MKFKTVFFLLVFFSSSFFIHAQIPVGKWRDHFSYKKVSCVTDAGDKIFAASDLALFSFDKRERSFEKLSKVNGLSDSEIQKIAWHTSTESLVIIYKNSNIDILVNNTIYNLSELKRKQIAADKTVYDIFFYDNLAFLSCGFGIVVIDLERLEFKDTYIIGENASYVKVNDVTINESNIYAAADEGLFTAVYDLQLLFDYRNWSLVEDLPGNDFKHNLVRSFSNILFANQIDPNTENDTLYKLQNGEWQIFNMKNINKLVDIYDNNERIIFISSSACKVFDKNLNHIRTVNWYQFPGEDISTWTSVRTAIIDDSDELYIADKRFGLVYTDSGLMYYVYPNGPHDNSPGRIFHFNNTLLATNGEIKAAVWNKPQYNVFSQENWNTYKVDDISAFNFYAIAVHPQNQNNYFIGAWGYGVFEFLNNELVNHYYPDNSSLQNIEGYGYGYSRIYDIRFDNNMNMWVSNPETGEPISVKTPDNEWESFNFGGSITNYRIEDIRVLENNHKWILLGESKGVMVLDDNDTPLDKDDDTFLRILPNTSDGERFNTVTALAQDKDGNLWLGTEEGIVVYYDPDEVFSDNFYADRIQLTSFGNDTTEQYLLSTDIITDIEIDGANRKWIATQSSGVFLVSENGKEEILNFNQYNSPLPSNKIVDIALNHISGEVFFLNEKGILSYRSDATVGGDVFGDVYVFPNPVRPGYDGVITVAGLADGVNVKFTDISGNLVYETDALGGQAVWDGKTFKGRKVSSGVYMVFCSNEDGSQTFVTKFLFMN